MKYSIVEATKKDIFTISSIHAKSWKSGYKGIVPDSYLKHLKENFWINTFEDFMKNGMIYCAIAYDKKQPVGVISFGKAREEAFLGYGEIISLYVLPEYFGREVGKELMKYALEYFEKEGICQCYLWVLKENERGIRFYEKMGFWKTEDISTVKIEEKILIDIRYCKNIIQ